MVESRAATDSSWREYGRKSRMDDGSCSYPTLPQFKSSTMRRTGGGQHSNKTVSGLGQVVIKAMRQIAGPLFSAKTASADDAFI